MQKIRKVIFLVPSPFNERDFKRFGIDILNSNGFEVFVYDFSPLIYPKLYEVGVTDPIEYENYICFDKKNNAIKSIRVIEPDSFVILYVSYSKNSFWIYKTLSKSKIPYLTVLACSIPFYKIGKNNRSHCLFFLCKRISRLSVYGIFKKIGSIPYKSIFAHYFGVRPPVLLKVAGAETINNYKNSTIIGINTEVLHTPSFDYNIYFDMKLPKQVSETNSTGAVYLDPGLLNIRGDDLALEKDCDLDRAKQCSNLCRFFNKVEEDTMFKVSIAAHPGYKGDCYPKEFGERLMVVNKTACMISRSNFIMTHSSTAVSFAVIFKKPIVFLTLNPKKERIKHKDPSIEQMASWFGKIPINIDHQNEINWENELKVDEDLYLRYKNSFLITNGTEELNSWQLLANRLKRM